MTEQAESSAYRLEEQTSRAGIPGGIACTHADVDKGTVAHPHREVAPPHFRRLPTVHRDQKIGLSLGVLLVGFTAAFCFRNEPLSRVHPLALEQAAALDSRIEQLSVRAYTQREGVDVVGPRPMPFDSGSDIVDASFVDQPISAITADDASTADIVAVYPGPPEPMPDMPRDAVPAVHQMATTGADASVPPDHAAAEPSDGSVTDPGMTSQMPTHRPQSGPSSRRYVVKSGDTLSGVSLNVYGTGGRYLEIFQANRDVLRDPDDLPVGTLLRIP
jgi:hypothetical protein